MSTLPAALVAFTALLRDEYGFAVAQRETHDALRALDAVGLQRAARVRAALRAVYCSTPDEAHAFDAAFEAFFRGRRGLPQPNVPPPRPPAAPRSGGPREGPSQTRERKARRRDDATAGWEELQARYSRAAATSEPPAVALEAPGAMLAAASALVERTRIARSRRRAPHRRGSRVDLRRTLRAATATGGEPIELRRTAPSRRSARFVLVIDGSRSMGEANRPALQFAHALCRRTRRARAFAFSTGLREITGALRDADQGGNVLPELGEAWGGGTRIGDSLAAFVREHPRAMRPETIVMIFSDGLDVGSLDALARAIRELARRTAGLVWVHPSAGRAEFSPQAGGLRTALPYVAALAPLRDAGDASAFSRECTRLFR